MGSRCRICQSPDHVMRGEGRICQDGFRSDYQPGVHDPHTGAPKREPKPVGQWVGDRWVVDPNWVGGTK